MKNKKSYEFIRRVLSITRNKPFSDFTTNRYLHTLEPLEKKKIHENAFNSISLFYPSSQKKKKKIN